MLFNVCVWVIFCNQNLLYGGKWSEKKSDLVMFCFVNQSRTQSYLVSKWLLSINHYLTEMFPTMKYLIFFHSSQTNRQDFCLIWTNSCFFLWALCTVHRNKEPRILKYFKRNSEKLKTFRNQNISLEIWYKFCSKTSKHDEFCCIILVSATFYFSWLQIFSVPKRKARTCWRYTAFEIKTAAHRFCVYF